MLACTTFGFVAMTWRRSVLTASGSYCSRNERTDRACWPSDCPVEKHKNDGERQSSAQMARRTVCHAGAGSRAERVRRYADDDGQRLPSVRSADQDVWLPGA